MGNVARMSKCYMQTNTCSESVGNDVIKEIRS
jgi:hypothetical protein